MITRLIFIFWSQKVSKHSIFNLERLSCLPGGGPVPVLCDPSMVTRQGSLAPQGPERLRHRFACQQSPSHPLSHAAGSLVPHLPLPTHHLPSSCKWSQAWRNRENCSFLQRVYNGNWEISIMVPWAPRSGCHLHLSQIPLSSLLRLYHSQIQGIPCVIWPYSIQCIANNIYVVITYFHNPKIFASFIYFLIFLLFLQHSLPVVAMQEVHSIWGKQDFLKQRISIYLYPQCHPRSMRKRCSFTYEQSQALPRQLLWWNSLNYSQDGAAEPHPRQEEVDFKATLAVQLGYGPRRVYSTLRPDIMWRAAHFFMIFNPYFANIPPIYTWTISFHYHLKADFWKAESVNARGITKK